jgi:hypothetical protein
MIDHKVETTRHQSGEHSAMLRVAVYNRAAAPLEVLGLHVISPDNVTLRKNEQGATFARTLYFWRDMPPFVPGSGKFPEAVMGAFISWPSEGCKVSILVIMRSKNQMVVRRLSRISITLAKNPQTTQAAPNPTTSQTTVAK